MIIYVISTFKGVRYVKSKKIKKNQYSIVSGNSFYKALNLIPIFCPETEIDTASFHFIIHRKRSIIRYALIRYYVIIDKTNCYYIILCVYLLHKR